MRYQIRSAAGSTTRMAETAAIMKAVVNASVADDRAERAAEQRDSRACQGEGPQQCGGGQVPLAPAHCQVAGERPEDDHSAPRSDPSAPATTPRRSRRSGRFR